MNDQQRAAMTMALEALVMLWEDGLEGTPTSTHDEAITALREALAQPVVKESLTAQTPVVPQEPVALETVYETIIDWDEGGKRSRRELARRIAALYTTPPSSQLADAAVEAMRIETLEKAAKVCEAEAESWNEFDEDCYEASASKRCAAAIRSMK
jgi:hypothetical protein